MFLLVDRQSPNLTNQWKRWTISSSFLENAGSLVITLCIVCVPYSTTAFQDRQQGKMSTIHQLVALLIN